MKKYFTIFIVLTLITLFFVGCAKNEEYEYYRSKLADDGYSCSVAQYSSKNDFESFIDAKVLQNYYDVDEANWENFVDSNYKTPIYKISGTKQVGELELYVEIFVFRSADSAFLFYDAYQGDFTKLQKRNAFFLGTYDAISDVSRLFN